MSAVSRRHGQPYGDIGQGYARARATVHDVDAIGLKVFSATKSRDRERLGETITDWIQHHPEFKVFERIVTQSSDMQFHCIAITVFYRYASAGGSK